MFSRDALDSFMDKAQRSDHRNRGVKTYATKTDITGEERRCQSPCHMCKKNHDMDNCKKFLELTVNDRSRYLAKNKLCFGCYDPISSNHSAKTCSKRIICKECKNYHPTALHGYQYKKQKSEPGKNDDEKKEETQLSNRCTEIEDFSNVSINQETSMVSMCVVPVIVKHKNSSREVKTFAMLDNCSQGTFVKEDLLKKLKIGGRATSISIKTLNGENTFQSHAVDGLQVCSSNAKSKKIWLNLPTTYTQNQLPVDTNEVATLKKLEKWKYLEPILGEISDNDDPQVDLLIGANCVKALEPIKVISSEVQGPYAYKTVLGGCVVGPMGMNKAYLKEMKCNNIYVCEANSVKKS